MLVRLPETNDKFRQKSGFKGFKLAQNFRKKFADGKKWESVYLEQIMRPLDRLILYIPVNIYSVMSGPGHAWLNQY